MKKRICSLGMILVMVGMMLSSAGCGKTEKETIKKTESVEAKKMEQVVLNEVAHSIFYAPLYVAIEEGYFEEEGIDLTLHTGFGADI